MPEVYRINEKIHTDIKLDILIIRSEKKCKVQDEPKLVQDVTLLCDTNIPLQTNAQAQSMTEQKILLPDKDLQGRLIPITHASQRDFEI